MLQYDGTGNFRVLQATPATAQAIGMAGPGAIGRWLFPAVSAYIAKLADNGAAVSSFNSPAGLHDGDTSAGWRDHRRLDDRRRERQRQIDFGSGGWRRR